MKLIGLTGRKGSGKDTAAKALVDCGYANIKFAGALKVMLRAYLRYVGIPYDTINRLIDGDLKEYPFPALNGKSPRWAMQTLGTEWGRDLMHQEMWVDACMERCRQCSAAVVTDVRFTNEVDAIKRKGGTVVRIVRPSAAQDTHISETAIDLLPVDFEIINDGTIDDLHDKVLQIVSKL